MKIALSEGAANLLAALHRRDEEAGVAVLGSVSALKDAVFQAQFEGQLTWLLRPG